MSSKNKKTQLKTDPNDQTTSNDKEPRVLTKYGSQEQLSSGSPQPKCFTENTDELRNEFLGLSPEDPKQDTPTTPDTATNRSQAKYADLLTSAQIQQIDNHPHEERELNEEPEFNVKGNYHAENRFLQRRDNTHEDVPETLLGAWKTGVRVGIEHFDRDDFYGYQEARYNEIADIVMLMNCDGIIETVINIYKESMTLNTDHLLRCENPFCGRLYEKTEHNCCCHWCGYSQPAGRHKTKAEILPKTTHTNTTNTNEQADAGGTTQENESPQSDDHTLDTYCEECDTTFNTLTRLRLHNCNK
jgi:hypothetical protein